MRRVFGYSDSTVKMLRCCLLIPPLFIVLVYYGEFVWNWDFSNSAMLLFAIVLAEGIIFIQQLQQIIVDHDTITIRSNLSGSFKVYEIASIKSRQKELGGAHVGIAIVLDDGKEHQVSHLHKDYAHFCGYLERRTQKKITNFPDFHRRQSDVHG